VQSEPIQLVPVCPFTLMHRKVETLPPPDRMISRAITQCARALQNIEVFLDKAEADALSDKYDVGVLLTSRLARDQYPFIRQVQIACDYVNFGAARLSDRTAPKHEDNELTINELRARIRNTVAFALGAEDREYEGASERTISVTSAPGKTIRGADYLLQMVVPNTFFHVTLAYAILRHNGINIGKMDFLGNINFVG
jgi:hypothetical protein